MTNIKLITPSYGLLPGVILFSLLVSGCQTIPMQPVPETATVVSPGVAPESIATHEFELIGDQNMIGTLATIDTRENDTLSDIARHFGLGYNDITQANPAIAAWTPKPGSRVLLPLSFILPDSPHQGIILNLANMRLFYYPKKESGKVYTYPVGIGRQDWNTPTGVTYITTKKANPSWYVPDSIHKEHAKIGDPLPAVIGPGPDNPLGFYAMNLGFERYLIHGTNKPYGIGMQISHGCVQLYPEDIETLFRKVAVGMQVRIVHQPYLTAWHDNSLYLEANEPLSKWSGDKARLKKKLLQELRQISTEKGVTVDWVKVDRVIERSDGIPTPILLQSPSEMKVAETAILIKHPDRLYQQPVVGELKNKDLAALVASFNSEIEAQKLAAMLMHQGPMIPARKVQKDNNYLVIAGPFKSKKELKSVAKRVRMYFEIDIEPLKPDSVSVN